MKTNDSNWRNTLSPFIHFWGLILYGYLLFENAMDLNELTITFSALYFIAWLLISVYLKYGNLIHKPHVHVLIIICLLSQVVLISVKALTDDTERVAATHRELILLTGSSEDFLELTKQYPEVTSVKVRGDSRKGYFHYPFDFIVEVKLTHAPATYYFMCVQDVSCSTMELVKKSILP